MLPWATDQRQQLGLCTNRRRRSWIYLGSIDGQRIGLVKLQDTNLIY